MLENEQVELKGIVEGITFRNEETGFTVIDMEVEDELVVAVGVLPCVDVGETLRVIGNWDNHVNFGKQFRVKLFERSMPKTSADLLKYLSSGAVKGIGPSTALKIVEAFGENSFDVLENDTKLLATIKGISEKKAESISKIFKEQFAVREIMISLEKYGMTPNECIKAFQTLGNNVVTLIEKNPYLLCTEIIGIGFERADSIAKSLPVSVDDSFRIRAGILHVVKHNLYNGHTCVPRDRLLHPSAQMLSTDEETIEKEIQKLIENKQIVSYKIKSKEHLFLPHIFMSENNIARRIKLMTKFPPAGQNTLLEDIKKIEKDNNIEYESKQKKAIITAIEKGMLILTGGPGTGKTTTLNGIIKLFEKQSLEVALAAPTGRAAKRMSELTGQEAKTIHRLLEVEWDKDDRQSFARNFHNPLSAKAVVVDELSMVDVVLFSALLDALPLGCRLVMVGDVNQLPAVGAGNVLHDLIKSGLIPVVELTEVFRQALESNIVTNAHKIVSGEMIEANDKNKDFFVMERKSAINVSKTISDLCTERLPKAYDYSLMTDIQVLCPSRKGETGTVNINRILQEKINPHSPDKKEIVSLGRVLREGDKVMQIKNNYDITWHTDEKTGEGVFNGDIGTLLKIDFINATLTVLFDDKTALYPLENVIELEHAYAVTVHKSQGNEFNCVIMPVFNVIEQLSYRNLLYTAVTRAKNLMIILGRKDDIKKMIDNNKRTKRFSALRYLLEDE